MPITIQFRRGTLSQWTGANPILASGEPGLDLTNMLLKVGDGSRNWNNLPYISVRLSGGTGIGLSQNPDGSYTISSPLSISGIGLSRTYNNSPSGNYTLSLSTGLQSIANLNIPINNYLYTTEPNTFGTGLITSAGRSLLASNSHTHSVSDITNFNSEVSGLIGSSVVYTTGNQNISGIKTFTAAVSAPTGDWNYLVSTGNILTNFVTPTNIKFKYDNMGIDDITTLDELLKRLVDKALYTQVIASISNNRGTTIQPGTIVSNATYTVFTSAGALSTGYISGLLIPTTYINSIGPYLINFTNSLNSGQNQSYTYTLSYNDVKRVAAGSSFLSTTTSIRFIDFKYYGLSRSGDLNNCGNQTSLQNSFTTYLKDQSLNRSLSYTYIATNTNQYYLWYIIPSGGFTQYSLDNNFIPSSNVSVGGFADSNWKFIGSYNLINEQNYTHPYYFYRYDTIQVGTFNIPVVFN